MIEDHEANLLTTMSKGGVGSSEDGVVGERVWD